MKVFHTSLRYFVKFSRTKTKNLFSFSSHKKCRVRGSNSRPLDYETNALPITEPTWHFLKWTQIQAYTVAVFNMYKFLKNIYMLVSHYTTILLQHAYYQTHTNTFLPLEAYSYTLSITLILLHAY